MTFKIKSDYYFELLTPESIKALWGTANKITQDKASENVLHLGITEVILVHCNICNNC